MQETEFGKHLTNLPITKDTKCYFDLLRKCLTKVLQLLYNTIQYNTIQYNTIQYNTIQYTTIQ